jgi:D-amino peptidase
MKIYILTDLEGVAGVVEWEHANSEGRYYERSKRLLTQEVNAAVEGALEAGATEIVVWDGHGPGGMEVELLHPEAKLLMGRGAPKGLGLDRSFDAMFVVGQHAMNLTPDANLCHSYNSRGVYRMLLNGQEIGELGMRIVLAGYFGVPVALVTGDDKTCAEALALVGDVETVAVKRSTGRQSALCLAPLKARELIKAGAIRALKRLSDFKPYLPPGPYEYVVERFDKTGREPDDRSWDQPVGRIEVSRSEDFLEVSR